MTELTPDDLAVLNSYATTAALGGVERGFSPAYVAVGLLFAAMELARQEFGPDGGLTWLEKARDIKMEERPDLWFPDRRPASPRPALSVVQDDPED